MIKFQENIKDDADYSINITLRLIFNSLSCIGSLFIIISFWKFKRLRKFAFKLICYLSISDLVFSIATFLIINNADSVNSHFCTFQGFALYYSSLSTIFWTSCIAYSMQKVVTTNTRDIENKEKWLLIIGYLLPAFLAIIPLISGDYGPSSFITDNQNRWCGIIRERNSDDTVNPRGIILDWVVRFFPILICFSFNMIMYCKVRNFFKNLELKTDLMDVIKNKIKYFPLIPIFCWSMEIILRILELVWIKGNIDVFNHSYIVYIEYFDSVFEKSHGFLNALLYGVTQYVKQEWKDYYKKVKDNSKINRINSFEETLNTSGKKSWNEEERRLNEDSRAEENKKI